MEEEEGKEEEELDADVERLLWVKRLLVKDGFRSRCCCCDA